MRGQAGHDLADHEGQDQRQRGRKPPGVRTRRRAMGMPLRCCHDLTISSSIKDR
jgi:hypothetical protein